MLADKFLEIAFICPFCDDDEFIVMNEGINVLDDVRMVEGFHEVNLLEAFLSLFLIGHVEDLNG